MKPKPKYKLVCFDLDGTIIDKTSSVWHTIHEKLGTDKEARRKAIEDFHAGRITYQQWADGDMRAWKKVGANKEKILEAIQHLRLMTGALETIQELKRKGLKLTIISGSIDLVLEKVFPNYKEFFDDIYINRVLFDEQGNIIGIKATEFDMEHKAGALKEIAARERIALQECVFIGDHYNDVAIAREAGFSIAFNCQSDTLAQVVDVVIEKKDLREILKYIV